LSGYFT